MKRIKNAFLVFIWVLKNPISVANFETLTKILELLLEVAEKKRHLMTRLCFVTVDGEESSEFGGVSIWAGAGDESSPTNRIAELLAENDALKERVRFLEDQLD